ncbi:MAG TPA: SDR family oxidoreductase [Flavisolibacter sp.]|nr:SDR family oxidoreductase [Flavisolibacter sp.]
MSFALITGASKGIGKSIALQLAANKKDLLLIARSEQQLQELATDVQKKYGIKAYYLSMDLSRQEASRHVFNWCSENGYDVDMLINNAGYGLSGSFERYTLEEHVNMMQLNMNVVVEMTYLFLPQLKKQSKAYILNIASSAAYQAIPYLSLYAASKSFVLQFSRGLHHELKQTNVSVTCVNPGATDTAFVDRANVGTKGLELAKKFNMRPDEVAKIALDGMYKGKTEVITGFLNKLGAALAWLLPKKTIEKASAKIYQ